MPSAQTASAIVINFSRFRLELHVQKAIGTAWRLSGGRPVDAGHLLRGAMIVARTQRSQAFSKLVSLLPLSGLSEPAAAGVPPVNLAATPVVRPVAEAFSVAEGFLADQGTMWGRDYVTLALLVKEDPSLDAIAQQAGVPDVESLRRQWLEFVRASPQRRTPESWERWWQSAGFPLPEQTTGGQPTAAAYLLTWNPARYPFAGLERALKDIEAQGRASFRWNTGQRRRMSKGDRVFLLRQGPEPRGLVGVGEVAGEVEELPHWDESQRKRGRKSLLVDVHWQALSREPLIELSRLIEETGETSTWSTQSGGVELRPEIVETLENLWPGAWARRLHGLEEDHIPTLSPRQWIARFDADTGAQADSLNIDRYVDAFARVMASRSLSPPLSIGLFGDWGSGKTFFMERLRKRVEQLSAEDGGDSPLYWPRICQISFNAWHYAETDLWASLVSTIFNELRDYLDGGDRDADEFNTLLKQLELAGELRKEAQARVDDAADLHRRAAERVERAREELEGLREPPEPSDAQLREILARSVAEVGGARVEEIHGLLESAAEWSGREDFREAARRLKQGQDSVAQARRVLEDVSALSARAGFWWRVLSTAKLHRSPRFWLVVAVLVLIPVGFGLAHDALRRFGGWAHVWAVIGEVLTAGGAALAWVRSRLATAGPVFDRLDALQTTVERRIEEARSADRAEFERRRAEALEAERQAHEKLERLREELARAAESERQAKAALHESTSQARLGRFIRERAATADYESHLGLIAMIHRDFRRLSKLMRPGEEGPVDPSLPRIDRIILYIDDLDRCHPPERVVRVLEAVHLLLFFPLFVVVVGVDSRWISRSLYKHYRDMLADEAIAAEGSQGELQRAPADSQDFLEKIFQVPFWLRRMDPSSIQKMIHAVISEDELAGSAGPAAEPPPPPLDDDEDLPEPQADAPAAAEPSASVSPAEKPGRAAAKRVTVEAESDRESIGEPLAAPTETLTISRGELDFMDQVAPLMPRTPRSVKRFVNIYRLYKSALSTPALARFLGTPERAGNYRAVQVLLALVTGTPRFARKVFDVLNSGTATDAETLADLVEALDQDDESAQTTLEALREFARDENNLKLDALREVSPLVGRYSVHHMISEAPGQSDLG